MFNLTEDDLNTMASVDIRTVDINKLTDIRDIKIDTRLPVEQKLASLARQTDNLYLYRLEDYIIKVKYQDDGPTIDDKMEEYLKHLAEVHI
ncbi:MAG: hypothetical protein NC412_13675 [Roseburia sp.]|nr:hypothetical protein [Roseburia sp.]